MCLKKLYFSYTSYLCNKFKSLQFQPSISKSDQFCIIEFMQNSRTETYFVLNSMNYSHEIMSYFKGKHCF